MAKKISELIKRFVELTGEETELVDKYIPTKSFKKGHVLLSAGQVSKESYFVIEGCVRSYYIKDGEEITTEFYVEEENISSLHSYIKQVPANHYFECVEDCLLAVMYKETEEELYQKVPKMESLCRVTIEEEFGEHQIHLGDYFTKSPEERYTDLLTNRPDLFQRLPQYLIASYIGVKPESLSRIRRRLAKQ